MIEPSVRLRRAIRLGDLVLVRHIVTRHPDLLQNPDPADGNTTSLHLAATLGHVLIVEFLLDAGHETVCISRTSTGRTPLHAAVAAGRDACAARLLARCPHTLAWRDRAGRDALMLAARGGRAALVSLFLRAANAGAVPAEAGGVSDGPDGNGDDLSVSAGGGTGGTGGGTGGAAVPLRAPPPLSPLATLQAPPADARALLGAADAEGDTALHGAAAQGELKALRALLLAGADATRENAQGLTPVRVSRTREAMDYFVNLVMEVEKRRSEEQRAGARAARQRREEQLLRRPAVGEGASSVRMVPRGVDEEDEEEEEEDGDGDGDGRSVAASVETVRAVDGGVTGLRRPGQQRSRAGTDD